MKDSLAGVFQPECRDLSNADPDDDGRKNLSHRTWNELQESALSTDSIYLMAARKDSMQSILLHSEMAELEWSGRYKITEDKPGPETDDQSLLQNPGIHSGKDEPAKLANESPTQTLTRFTRI